MTDKYELSRRKTLAGLATIGAAGAGAGLGTSAFFSDTEEFTNNSFTAGEFDLAVTGEISALDQDGQEEYESLPVSEEADGEAVSGLITLTDMKPGDSLTVCFTPSVSHNPGYVCASIQNQNDLTGLEAENIDQDDIDDLPGIDGSGDLETLGENLEIENITWNPDGEDIDLDPQDDIETLADLDEFSSVLVPGDVVEGEEIPEFQDYLDTDDEPEVCFELLLPTDVENEVQGAEFSFNVLFEAEQERHNEDPFDGDCYEPQFPEQGQPE